MRLHSCFFGAHGAHSAQLKDSSRLRVCTPFFTSAHSAQNARALCTLCTLCTRVFGSAQAANRWCAPICALVHSVHSKNVHEEVTA